MDQLKILISNTSEDPIYLQIVIQIKQLILNESLSDGDMLPSIRELAKLLKVSVITTKRAYQELESEGFVGTVKGKGTFVASQSIELLKEKKLLLIQEMMTDVIKEAKELGMSIGEIKELIDLLDE